MIQIDSLAAASKMSRVHPAEKLLFTALLIFFAQVTRNFILPVVLITGVSLIIVLAAAIPARQYLKLLLIPMVFILLAVVPLIVSLQPGGITPLAAAHIGDLYMEITAAGLKNASLLCLKAFASITAFYFFILTTPFSGLEYILKKAKIPSFLREIILLTYRYIFVFLRFFGQMKLAQELRGGYRGIYRSFSSLAGGLVVLVRRMLQFGLQSSQAMVTRGCRGEIRFAGTNYHYSLKNWVLMAAAVLANSLLWVAAG